LSREFISGKYGKSIKLSHTKEEEVKSQHYVIYGPTIKLSSPNPAYLEMKLE
jgi:hypothetical protein